MERGLALRLLGLGPNATADEIDQAYWAQCAELEDRIRISPTSELRRVYRDALQKLEQARGVLMDELERSGALGTEAPPDAPPPASAGEAEVPVEREEAEEPPAPEEEAAAPEAEEEPGVEGGGAMSAEEVAVGFFEGQVLLNRYEIHRRVALGPHGAVYAAYDRRERREVTIKVLLPILLEKREIRDRFLAETKIASNLSHPGVAQLFGVENDGALYLVISEGLPGKTLRQWMNSRKGERFSIREVQQVGSSLCDVLQYAHQHIVHRDLKPENVFMESTGGVKLTDFGTAVLREGFQKRPANPYLAPEIDQPGAKVDPRADQYSVAAILYEMLTGVRPESPVHPVRRIRTDVPAGMAEAIDRGLKANPAERFASIQELAQRLKAGGRSAPAISPVAAGVAAAVLVLALAGVALLGGGGGDEGEMPAEEGSVLDQRAERMRAEATAEAQAAAARARAQERAAAEETAAAERAEATRAALLALAPPTATETERPTPERVTPLVGEPAVEGEETPIAEPENAATATARAITNAVRTQIAAEAQGTATAAALADVIRTRVIAEQTATAAAAEGAVRTQIAAERRATADARAAARQTAEAVVEARRTETALVRAEAASQRTAQAREEAERRRTETARVAAVRTATAEAERERAAREELAARRTAAAQARVDARRTATAAAVAEATLRREVLEARGDFIPSINATVKSLQFYEKAPGETLPEAEREHANKFKASETRAVFWELTLVHPPQGRRRYFTIRSVCRRSDGSVFGEGSLKTFVEANWAKSTHTYGWGFEEPGLWERDTYEVELYVDNKKVAEESFRIYEGFW